MKIILIISLLVISPIVLFYAMIFVSNIVMAFMIKKIGKEFMEEMEKIKDKQNRF